MAKASSAAAAAKQSDLFDVSLPDGSGVPGPMEATLAITLAEWVRDGTLAGPVHASSRALLRDSARCVDIARVALDAGTLSALGFARCLAEHHLLLAAVGAPAAKEVDSLDALLAEFSDSPLRN